MQNRLKTPGKIKCLDVQEQPDGSAKVIFEADEEFKQWFKDKYNLKRWSEKRFNKFLQEAIDRMAASLREGKDANEKEKEKSSL
jgi:hypothetical protein